MATTPAPTTKKKKKAKGLTPEQQLESDLTKGGELGSRFGPDTSGPGWQHLSNPMATPEMTAFGGSLAGFAGVDPTTGAFNGDYGGQFSGDIKDIIGRMKSGLSGYAAPELQAMREQASRGIEGATATSLRGLAGAQAKAGVRGASALAGRSLISRQGRADKANMEQDIFIKNADEQQNRLKSFGDYIGQQTTGQQNALGSWGRFLTTKAGAQGATDAANAQLDQTKTLMDTNSRLGFAGQLQAGRNDAWTKRFMKEHPNAYQGGAGGSSSSSWGASTDPEALNKIAQAFQDKMNGIATTSTTTTPTTQPDIPYPH